jgi:hypothetical protein
MPGRDSDTARRQQLTSHPRLGGLLLNFLAAAVGLGVVLGVVAYAVSDPDAGSAHAEHTAWRTLLPAQVSPTNIGGPRAPRIVGHPEPVDTSTEASFDFTEPAAGGPFSCRLDEGAWSACASPVSFTGLSVGVHDFLVRAHGHAGRAPEMSYMRWSVVRPSRFLITSRLSDLEDLYPGAPPVVLPIKVTNPGRAPIAVTQLVVTIPQDPPGCPSARNLQLISSNVSSARPLRLRAGGSAWLPGRGVSAPAIRMRNRPVNQNRCQRARFKLVFTGTAHG